MVYIALLVRKANSFFEWLWLAKKDRNKNCAPWGNTENKEGKWDQIGSTFNFNQIRLKYRGAMWCIYANNGAILVLTSVEHT